MAQEREKGCNDNSQAQQEDRRRDRKVWKQIRKTTYHKREARAIKRQT